MAFHVLAHMAPASSLNVTENFICVWRLMEFASFLDLEMEVKDETSVQLYQFV